MPVQVGLVVEPDGCGDVGDRLPRQQPPTGRLDPAAGEVAVRRQPERAGERADEVGRVGVQEGRRVAQRETVAEMGVEQVTSVMPGTPGDQARTPDMPRTYKKSGSGRTRLGRVRFDTKIVVLLRDDLETWQRLNVTAFLSSGIAGGPRAAR